jgi:hypothetical protein
MTLRALWHRLIIGRRRRLIDVPLSQRLMMLHLWWPVRLSGTEK